MLREEWLDLSAECISYSIIPGPSCIDMVCYGEHGQVEAAQVSLRDSIMHFSEAQKQIFSH